MGQQADTSTFQTCRCTAGDTMGVERKTTITDNNGAGHFFALYVGDEDVDQQTAYRSGAGSLPATIDSDPSGWGLDWTMPMTTTWIDSKTDEWDMDVDVTIPWDGLQTNLDEGYRLFASTRERYPSDERSYDVAVVTASVHSQATSVYSQAGLGGKGFATSGAGACTLLQAAGTQSTYGLCLAACDTLAGTQTGNLANTNGEVSLADGTATSENYYAGWTIVTDSPAGVGTIATSLYRNSKVIITIAWLPQGASVTAGGTTHSGSSTIPTIHASNTAYTLYPPSSSTTLCNAAQYTDSSSPVCQLFNCPSDADAYLVDADALDQTYLKSPDTLSLVVPHYTFSSSWLYLNIEHDSAQDTALSGHIQITKTEKTSSRSISTDPAVPATGCTSAFCNYNGNCIDDSTDGQHPSPYCVCSDGYTGDDCSIAAFSAATTISTSSNFLGSVATGFQYGSAKSGGGSACTDMTGLSHHGCLRITSTLSGSWTLKDGINHQTTADYYKNWNIVVSGDGVFGTGVITASNTNDPPVLTITWDSDATPTTSGSTTWTDISYTIWTNVERGQMSAPMTLQSNNLHSTAVDYYKGWAIATTANPSGGAGTITGNSATGLLTVQWTSLSGTTGTSTTYTLTPPTQCNTQNEWQANGDDNDEKDFASANTLNASVSPVDDYYNGMSLTVTSGAGKSEETGTVSAVSVSNGVQDITLQASNNHWTASANYYTGFSITLCSGACASTEILGTGTIATSATSDPPEITVTWSSIAPTADTSSGYVLTHPGYTITDYIGSTKTVTTAPALPTTAPDGGSFPTTAYVINTCSTGHSWNDASKTCTRYSGPYEHVWEPFVYIGEGNLQHCAPIENLIAPTNNVKDCRKLCSPERESGTMASATQLQSSNDHSTQINFYVGWTIVTGTPVGTGNPITFGTGDSASRGVERGTITQSLADLTITVEWDDGATRTLSAQTTYTLTPPPSACNAFTHDSSSPECKLYTCPTAVAPVTTAAETMAGSWGVDETASKRAYHRAPLTCCAADDDWTVATKCTNPVPGYYDEESCTSVQGVTTAAACEQVVAGDKEMCENSPATTVEDTCELKPYDEVPEPLCSPEAIRNGYDGSTTAKSCDAFDVVKLDCGTHKCTPSAAGANPYKIGYVKCVGSDCTINAAKPIVEIPYVVAGLPAHSKVLTYEDSQPYPAKGANSQLYSYNCEASDAT